MVTRERRAQALPSASRFDRRKTSGSARPNPTLRDA
jgi:hypothetical protein